MRFAFTLTGAMPLLMHADDIEASDGLMEWRKDPAHKNVSVAGDDRSPAWTWQTYLYHDDAGNVCMPSHNIMVALRQAGAQIIMKKQKTFKEATQSGLLITSEYCQFSGGKGSIQMAKVLKLKDLSFTDQAEAVLKLGFRLFCKRAKIGQSKHIRVRPRFDAWSVNGVVEIFESAITGEILQTLFDLAGKVGLCDWRPGCKTPGPFGQFTAELKAIA